jgi:hypothetical protein
MNKTQYEKFKKDKLWDPSFFTMNGIYSASLVYRAKNDGQYYIYFDHSHYWHLDNYSNTSAIINVSVEAYDSCSFDG